MEINYWVRSHSAPKNGILLRNGSPTTVFVNRAHASRDVRVIICGGPNKTYAFPSTVTTAAKNAFEHKHVRSVRLNEGLKVLRDGCFEHARIRKLVLSSSVESVGNLTFQGCQKLEYVDLSAARGLKLIGWGVFSECKALRKVILNDGLKAIRLLCF